MAPQPVFANVRYHGYCSPRAWSPSPWERSRGRAHRLESDAQTEDKVSGILLDQQLLEQLELLLLMRIDHPVGLEQLPRGV